jgi:hypothetical protein
MDEIHIYDVANQLWYTQKATGNIPGSRARFVAGLASAPDNSSFNV